MLNFIKKNSIELFFILIGGSIFYLTKDYKSVPSGIGADFFPRAVATILIFLCLVCIYAKRKVKTQKTVETPNKEANLKIIGTLILLVLIVILMQYVHPLCGIFVFMFLYLKFIGKLQIKETLVITILGTIMLYFVIVALRIPM